MFPVRAADSIRRRGISHAQWVAMPSSMTLPLGSRPLIPASHCSERVVTRLVFTAATDLDNLLARLPAVLAAKLLIFRHLTLTVTVRTFMPVLRHARPP